MQKLIEAHFKMSFKDVIFKLHHKGKRSIHSLGKEVGLSHTPFVRLAKLHGIKLRDKTEASRLALSQNNPINNPRVAAERAKTVAIKYRNNPWPQEILFERILKRRGIKYIFQYPIGPYVIDFFIPSKKLCVEIDSMANWGSERLKKAKEKDAALKSKGYSVARLNKKHLKRLSAIFDILEAHDLI